MGRGYAQGKANSLLAMDTFPVTGMVMTASLDGIVTDSSPGMSNYVTGNKSANNTEGVFPDDTLDAFDNPRIEYLSEYLHRTQGKALGIVTTADVFDATPAAMAVHTSNRGHGTGIVDQYLDDRGLTGLTVLMGGGRKWFLPNGDALKPNGTLEGQPMNGSQRDTRSDYELPSDLVAGWGACARRERPAARPDRRFSRRRLHLRARPRGARRCRLGDQVARAVRVLEHERGVRQDQQASRRLDDRRRLRLPDQPMLDEMTRSALGVLSKHKQGFIAMIEGASIDKQEHLMDTDRWLLEVLEFDRAVQVKLKGLRHPAPMATPSSSSPPTTSVRAPRSSAPRPSRST